MKPKVLPTLRRQIAACLLGCCLSCLALAVVPTPASLQAFDDASLSDFWNGFGRSNPAMISRGLSYLGILLDGVPVETYRRPFESCIRVGQGRVNDCVFEAMARSRAFDPRVRARNWLGSRVSFSELLRDPLGSANRLNGFFEYYVRDADPEAFSLQTALEREARLSPQQKAGFRLALAVTHQLRQSCAIALHTVREAGFVSDPFPLHYGDKLFAQGPEGIYACKSKVATEACNALTLVYAGNADRQVQETLLPTLRSVCRLTDENGAFIEEKRGRDN